MSTTPHRHRPFVVTILAIGAGILAVLAGVHFLQSLGILPYVIGRVEFRSFSFFYAIMWGLLLWVWIWLIQALWNVEPQAWIFLVIITIFNMIYDFVVVLGAATWSDVSVSFLVNAVILLYCVLPSTKRAFEISQLQPQPEPVQAPPAAAPSPPAAAPSPPAAAPSPPAAAPSPPAAAPSPPESAQSPPESTQPPPGSA